jgi:hypothetical protein
MNWSEQMVRTDGTAQKQSSERLQMAQFHQGRKPLVGIRVEMPLTKQYTKQYTSDSEIYIPKFQNIPNHGESERPINMHK